MPMNEGSEDGDKAASVHGEFLLIFVWGI